MDKVLEDVLYWGGYIKFPRVPKTRLEHLDTEIVCCTNDLLRDVYATPEDFLQRMKGLAERRAALILEGPYDQLQSLIASGKAPLR